MVKSLPGVLPQPATDKAILHFVSCHYVLSCNIRIIDEASTGVHSVSNCFFEG